MTPGGSGMSDRNLVSFRLMPDMSTSRNSGRSFGRQTTSTSARRCDTTPPWTFTPGEMRLALEVNRQLDADLLVLDDALQINVHNNVARRDASARP